MENLEMNNIVSTTKNSLGGLSNRLEIIDLNSDAPIIILNVTDPITIIKDIIRMGKPSKIQLNAVCKKPT